MIAATVPLDADVPGLEVKYTRSGSKSHVTSIVRVPLPVNVPVAVFTGLLPPLAVPVVIVPFAARKTLPLATSAAVAVVTEASSNRAVPPPVFGRMTAGTPVYDAPIRVIFCATEPPPYDIVKIFVVLSCEILGRERLPATPRSVTPLLILVAMTLACSVEEMLTVPPVVYPAGIVTVPALVLIVPLVEPLFAMLPLTDPLEPKAVLPVRTSAEVMSADAVS